MGYQEEILWSSLIVICDCRLYRVPYIPTILLTFLLGLVTCMLWAFYKLSPFSYGSTSLRAEEILGLMWKDTWDFLIRASRAPPPQ
jgi:dolichyl-phosphate-mannose--protein O-mannosyl transferase